VFPQLIARLINQGAAAMPCAPDLIGVPMLAVLGTAIGTSYEIQVKESWYEGPRIYSGVIGEPGDKKSPAEKLATHPLHVKQADYGQTFKDKSIQHDLDMLDYEVKLADWRAERKKDKTKNRPAPDKPPEPTMQQLLTVDTTVEALAAALESNPRGILLERDELTGWVLSMNQYKGGKGADRQYWLSFWNGATVVINRKGRSAPLILTNPFVCVTGGLTPDCLDDLTEVRGREDGFLPRILLAHPDPIPLHYSADVVTAEARTDYKNLIMGLLALGEKDKTTAATLTTQARADFIVFLNELYQRRNSPDCPIYLKHVIAKLEAYTSRLALVLQLCRLVSGESRTDNIDPTSVEGAAQLIRYFLAHAERIYPKLRTTDEDRQVEAAVSWIETHGRCVSARELQRHKVGGVKSSTEAKALLRRLEDRGFGSVEDHGSTRIVFSLF
jgi:Protein of unknown function (DUF3987)